MVGPGTGVAPFIGFLQHLQALKAQGDQAASNWGQRWLFFGCRHQNKDFIYRTDMEAMAAAGVLTRLVTAFSRDAEEVVYVQHRMIELAEELCPLLLDPSTTLFICGYLSLSYTLYICNLYPLGIIF